MASPQQVREALPLATRLGYAAAVFALQNLFMRPAFFVRDAYNSWYYPPEKKPTATKYYPCRPRLPVRFFYPLSYRDAIDPQPLPLLITIHGGGFITGSGAETDHLNVKYASEYGFLVASLDYGWAPANPFPGPVRDVEQLILATLEDATLPIDHSRVALMGWSAGGNLALSAAQCESLQGLIHALVPVYPVTDFTTTAEYKGTTRQWKPSLGGFRGRSTDFLTAQAPLIKWSYISVGQNLRDPLLSPLFADVEMLPKNIFVIGCEMDFLGHEGWMMVCKLAGREYADKVGQETTGAEGELILDDDRFHFEQLGSDNCYKWLLIPDTVHGFDHDISRIARDPLTMDDAKLKADKSVGIIGKWLVQRLSGAPQ